jgi:predicted transposase/invertase (TIGR01784 family)
MIFVNNQDLLKGFVAEILNLKMDSIKNFVIRNPSVEPEEIGKKFISLDILMEIDDSRVILEIQVRNEGNFRERALFYWSKECSRSLGEGENYYDLPQIIFIGILSFNLFMGDSFLKRFLWIEENTGEKLTEKALIAFVETKKLPVLKNLGVNHARELLLWLFRAETEKDLREIQGKGVDLVNALIQKYRETTNKDEFQQLALLREKALRDEATAIYLAVAPLKKELAAKDEELATKDTTIATKDKTIATKDKTIATKDEELAAIREELAALRKEIAMKNQIS